MGGSIAKKFSLVNSTPLSRALARVLLLDSWTITEEGNEAEASLLVIDHDARELSDFSVLDRVDTSGRRIVYFRPQDPGHPLRRLRATSWIYPVTEPAFDRRNFLEWLRLNTKPRGSGLEPADCWNALGTFLWQEQIDDSQDYRFARVLATLPPDRQDSFTALRETSSSLEMVCLLSDISQNLETVTHNEQRKLQECASDPEQAGATFVARHVVSACEDLRQSLLTPLRPCEREEPRAILLIDDRPQFYKESLTAVANAFLEGHPVWLWKPSVDCKTQEEDRREGRLTLHVLASYQSVTAPLNLGQAKICYQDLQGEEGEVLLADLPKRVQFIVVDQLYKTSDDEGEVLGPAIIRGLTRAIRDIQPPSDGNFFPPPEIVALSRASDPSVIQDALRSGARDYCLKSNLLALPAVLALVQRTVTDPPGTLQRNFRQLYNLPNEIAGVMRKLRIRPIAVHTEQQQQDYESSSIQGPVKQLKELLSAIPKPDLHVHVGSLMAPEFLVVASLVGLLQHPQPPDLIGELIGLFARAIEKGKKNELEAKAFRLPYEFRHGARLTFSGGRAWMDELARKVAGRLADLIKGLTEFPVQYSELRSVLHRHLAVRDHLGVPEATQAVRRCSEIRLCWFWIRMTVDGADNLSYDDLVRIYVLVLAAKTGGVALKWRDQDLLPWFGAGREINKETWMTLHNCFYAEGGQSSVETFRNRGWKLDAETGIASSLGLTGFDRASNRGDEGPPSIEWTIATGTRSNNLQEYLLGCEFSGSAHLGHPFLIHLYAQHLMRGFVDKGLLYAELRGSPDGYTNEAAGFTFSDVCQCLKVAFDLAQQETVRAFRTVTEQLEDDFEGDGLPRVNWLPKILGEAWSYDHLKRAFDDPGRSTAARLRKRYPPKIGLIFVGKRHKATRQMILEAAASAVMFGSDTSKRKPVASAFLELARDCEVVGFDLAGNEPEYAPGLFAEEFQRLEKLHIPMTVHAGENASAQFVEDAILELGAQRIGHALSLSEDKKLMARMREQRICVELCPVSNHQTCHFTADGQQGRTYPIREYMDFGIPVCLNTDNPIISRTDIVNEFFEASFAYGGDGLSLWDALRLIKNGFRHAFLALPKRRAMLEAVDQILFDMFSDPEVQDLLRTLVDVQN